MSHDSESGTVSSRNHWEHDLCDVERTHVLSCMEYLTVLEASMILFSLTASTETVTLHEMEREDNSGRG